MPANYNVRIAKEALAFSAAHFITLENNVCERLHGHNYLVAVDVCGPLNENQYVIDFIALRDALADIIAELDHHMLLPTEHPRLRVKSDEKSVEATFQDRRWVFPLSDCMLLPVANTTAEKLAEYIGRRLLDELERRHDTRPQRVRVEVDECLGQIGSCELVGQ